MKKRNIINLGAGIACLIVAGLLVISGTGVEQIVAFFPQQDSTSDQKPQTTRSSHHQERALREKRRRDCIAEIDAAFRRMLAYPKDQAIERELLSALAVWSAWDLSGVQSWIEKHDEQLPGSRSWLGDTLVVLAETQPLKALDFGLALNEGNLTTYSVPPRILLGIALRHLTAADAIRVMEMPLRGTKQYTVDSQSPPGAIYRSDFDFRALGDYLVRKEHAAEPHSWRPTSSPAKFVESWTEHDPNGAEAFCRAMNDRPDGAITGYEYLDYFNQLARQKEPSVVTKEILRVIADPDVSFSKGHMSYLWLQDERRRAILMEVVPHLTVEQRDVMGHDALIMNGMSSEPSAVEICAAAMHLFATDAERQSAIQVIKRIKPDQATMLRQAEEAFMASQ